MKLFSLIATLFFVTISGMEHSLHHHQSLFKNPKAFLSSLSQIDEDKINEMITMINKLISDGEDQRQAAIDSEASAQSDTEGKTDALVAAQGNVATAQGALDAARDELSQFISEEEEAKNIHDAAILKKATAKTDRDAKAKTSEDQGARIDEEKGTFEEIKSLIATISAGEASDLEIKNVRKLLNFVDYKYLVDADPQSLEAVVDLIDQLIEDGETERNGYINDFNQAESAFTDASAEADQTQIDWETAIGKVTRQEITIGGDAETTGLEQLLSAAQAAEDSAATDLNAARAELSKQQENLAAENARIDGEKQACEDIIDLLRGLLPQED